VLFAYSSFLLWLRIESAPTVVTQPSKTSSALADKRSIRNENSSHALSDEIVFVIKKYGATAKIKNPHA